MGNGGRTFGIGQGLQQTQKQNLTMTPALQQAIKLLGLTSPELTEFVAEEISNNPLLDWHPEGDGDAATDGADTASPDNIIARSDNDRLDQIIGHDGIIGAAAESLDAADNALYPELAPAVLQREQATRQSEDDWSLVEDQAGAARTLAEAVSDQIPDLALPIIDAAIAHILVGALDDTGYLAEPIAEIAERHDLDPSHVDTVRKRLGTEIDPTGLFATDLADCLRLQLTAMKKLNIAMDKLLTRLDLVAKRDLPALKRLTSLDEDGVRSCMGLLMRLDPKPGTQFTPPEQLHIAPPDVLITPLEQRKADHQTQADDDHDHWLVRLNPETLPRVIVNEDYYAVTSQNARRSADKDYLREAHNRANWLARALDQRARTITAVGLAIAKRQDGFLRRGITALVPITMADIAADIEMHESTVSRAIAGKTLDCPQGVFPLRFFFSAAIKAGKTDNAADVGDDHAAQAVKHRIKTLIDNEDPKKILSDDKIVALLKAEGITIARRTVAKYREAMNLGSSVERRRQKKLT